MICQPQPGDGPAGEQGAAALLTAGVGLLVATLLCAALPTAAGLAVTGIRARAAADAVALAVLAGSPLAAPPDRPVQPDVAHRVAGANGAVLLAVDRSGWPTAVVATVEVPAPGPLGGLVPSVRASGSARLEPP